MISKPAPDTCVLYLIRHGATEHNLAKPPRLQGSGVNGPLSETGREEARRVARALAVRKLAAVYSSPMLRAMQTAKAIAKTQELKVTTVDSFVEINVGNWENRSWDEIEQTEPEAYANFKSNPAKHGYPGGETLVDVINRVEPTLEELLQTHVGKEIAVVAHSMVNRVLVGTTLGLSPSQSYKVVQANCGLNVIQWRARKRKMVSVNGIGHLL